MRGIWASAQVARQVGSCPLESPPSPRRPGGQDAQRQGMDGTVLPEVELVPESVMSGLELAEQTTSRTIE